jgi:dienelactone hydrolase
MQHKQLLAGLLVLLMTLTALPTIAQDTLPTVAFPQLTGEYAVGQTMRAITDPSRSEDFTDETSDQRTLPVTFYYPAEPEAVAQPAPYISEAEAMAFAEVMGLPPALTQALQPNLVTNAPVAPTEGGYPVLLFMPGLGTPVRVYTALLEQVASHGYVVVVVDPVYSVALSFYPDGQYVTAVPAGLNVEGDPARNQLIQSWVRDARFVLDWLEEINSADALLASMFDLSRVGMFGHSFGGAASLQAAYEDARIAAAINMDGKLFGSVLNQELTTPFMIMNSEGSTDLSLSGVPDVQIEAAGMTREQLAEAIGQNIVEYQRLLTTAPMGYQLTVTGTQHNSFASDLGFMSDLVPEMLTDATVGTIESARLLQMVNDYVVAFFDTYVKEETSSLILDEPNQDYPEVTLGYSET